MALKYFCLFCKGLSFLGGEDIFSSKKFSTSLNFSVSYGAIRNET